MFYRKLTEVKSQINQLKSLVQGYQGSSMVASRGKPSDMEDPTNLLPYSDYSAESEPTRDRRLV